MRTQIPPRFTKRLVVGALALAAAGPLDAQPVVVRTFKRDTASRDTTTFTVRVLRTGGQDSLVVRIDSVFRRLEFVPLGSSERVTLEADMRLLMARLTALAGNAAGELGVRIGGAVRDNLREAISRAAIENGETLRQLRIAVPRGWIGIVAQGPQLHYMRDNEIIRYFGYPSIVSVEPNSPAERAGILAGDTLVAYDRVDVRDREINLTKLLVPNRTLAVAVRRDGDTKEYEMVVAKAPEGFARSRFEISTDSVVVLAVPGSRVVTGRRAGGGGAMVGAVEAGPQRIERMLPGAAPRGFVFKPFDGTGSVWGARLATINEGLGRTLGVKSGVLVTDVAPATPAAKSGLEAGDIILRVVGGRPLLSVDELRRTAMEHQGDHEVALQVRRDKKLRTITVSWPR
jgi:serine protease Do